MPCSESTQDASTSASWTKLLWGTSGKNWRKSPRAIFKLLSLLSKFSTMMWKLLLQATWCRTFESLILKSWRGTSKLTSRRSLRVKKASYSKTDQQMCTSPYGSSLLSATLGELTRRSFPLIREDQVGSSSERAWKILQLRTRSGTLSQLWTKVARSSWALAGRYTIWTEITLLLIN